MCMTNKRRYVLENKDGEYYTVFGWSAATTKFLSSAVVFPNEMLCRPKDGTWKRRAVNFEDGCRVTLKNG